ncbi:alpha/beta fold hydrolase [Sphingomonas sp. CARO-RG-8B-R24-01]|uniref:alpha/beta fold hydrolase n=1 Tax=Sphingomonas sp. CARO-RG-8B-R24-01 TaxID=2914831 RepID=UPI001F5ACE99|nr:alpha/beta fold hydrolase [Sphingomonas sp. CARO-RG-8B-R24-01]
MTTKINDGETSRTEFSHDGIMARTLGAGPPLFLFHSLLSDSASFDTIAPQLAEQFKVIIPDLPGFGGSVATAGSLEEVADRMASFVHSVAPNGDAILFGNGYGAFVALQIAIRHPALVASLILAGSGARFSEPGRDAFRGMAAAGRSKGLAAIADTAMARLFAPEFQAAHPDLMADRRAAFLRTDVAVFEAACLSLAALDQSAQLPALDLPVLMMVGEQDAATPPPMARELASLVPNAVLQILPGCAHVPPLQAPDLVIEAISLFLGKTFGKPSGAAHIA